MSQILKVKARQIYDSRGNPTVEAEVFIKNNSGEKKYKIVLLVDDIPKKVLFKSNVKRNIQQKFKQLGKSAKPSFTRKYVKRKVGTRPEKINVKRRKLK